MAGEKGLMSRRKQWGDEIRSRQLTAGELAGSLAATLAVSLAVAYHAADATWLPPDFVALSAIFISAATLVLLWALLICAHWAIVRKHVSKREKADDRA